MQIREEAKFKILRIFLTYFFILFRRNARRLFRGKFKIFYLKTLLTFFYLFRRNARRLLEVSSRYKFLILFSACKSFFNNSTSFRKPAVLLRLPSLTRFFNWSSKYSWQLQPHFLFSDIIY